MFNDFYEAYHWLDAHPIFKDREWRDSHFHQSLTVRVVKVNPQTERIDQEKSLNTQTRVWLEHGPYTWNARESYGACSHDIGLDCGASTFEEAVIKLANLAEKHYGDYDADAEYEKDQKWRQQRMAEKK